MTKEELINADSTFNESMFISKVDNILVKILSSIMLDNLDEVKHFMTYDIYERINEIIAKNKNDNIRKMYDELNVSETYIKDIIENENNYEIEVIVMAKYLDYSINLSNGKVIGNDNRRIDNKFILKFRKNKNAIDQGASKKCSNCGMSLDVNNNGLCNYCGTNYQQEKYDWVLVSINL